MSFDLNNLKTQIKSILDTANTTTASTDLSSGLNTRVQKVLALDPGRIQIQASWYPFVTCFIDSQGIEPASAAATQAQAKRLATINVKVVGAVMNTIMTDLTKDDSQDDCESLMQNIEDIFRANNTLNTTALWNFPSNVAYHNANLDEEAHIRVGIMDLAVKVLY